MANRQSKSFIGSPAWYLLQGTFLGLTIAGLTSHATGTTLSWIAIVMNFVMPAVEAYWSMRRSPRPAPDTMQP